MFYVLYVYSIMKMMLYNFTRPLESRQFFSPSLVNEKVREDDINLRNMFRVPLNAT